MKKEIYKALKDLIGKKIIKVIEFTADSFDEGIIIIFEGNIYLTAQDGEYGDNAFSFLTEKKAKEKISKTPIYLKKQEKLEND